MTREFWVTLMFLEPCIEIRFVVKSLEHHTESVEHNWRPFRYVWDLDVWSGFFSKYDLWNPISGTKFAETSVNNVITFDFVIDQAVEEKLHFCLFEKINSNLKPDGRRNLFITCHSNDSLVKLGCSCTAPARMIGRTAWRTTLRVLNALNLNVRSSSSKFFK